MANLEDNAIEIDDAGNIKRVNLPTPITEEAAQKALSIILSYGNSDGAHHKDWVLDQAVRALTGENYDEVVAQWEDGEEGPGTYYWGLAEGIAP